MVLTRPDLYAVLTKHLPTNKISFGKKVMSLVQDQNRATVMCSDRSVYHADIVIGADGTYSGIRQAMYAAIEKDAPVRAIHDVVKEQLRDLKQSEGGEGKTFGEGLKRMFRASTTNLNLNSGPPVTSADVQSVSTQNGGGIKVGKNKVMLPKSDIASLRFDHPAIVGVTEPLDTEKYPFLKDKCTQGITVLLKNGVSLWLFGVSSNRISFGVGGRALIDSNTQTTKENFKTSAWGTKDVDAIASRDWLRNIKLPFGGVFSDLLDKTPKDTVARIMMEDKVQVCLFLTELNRFCGLKKIFLTDKTNHIPLCCLPLLVFQNVVSQTNRHGWRCSPQDDHLRRGWCCQRDHRLYRAHELHL